MIGPHLKGCFLNLCFIWLPCPAALQGSWTHDQRGFDALSHSPLLVSRLYHMPSNSSLLWLWRRLRSTSMREVTGLINYLCCSCEAKKLRKQLWVQRKKGENKCREQSLDKINAEFNKFYRFLGTVNSTTPAKIWWRRKHSFHWNIYIYTHIYIVAAIYKYSSRKLTYIHNIYVIIYII